MLFFIFHKYVTEQALTKNRKSVIFKTENYNLYIMRKKNYFIIILALSAMVMSLSSCASLGYYKRIPAADYYLPGSQQGGFLGDMAEGAAGSWYDSRTRCLISITERVNWYTVTDRFGIVKVYYLMPLSEAIKGLPPEVRVMSMSSFSFRPCYVKNHDVLGWEIPTNRGLYVVSSHGYYPVH